MALIKISKCYTKGQYQATSGTNNILRLTKRNINAQTKKWKIPDSHFVNKASNSHMNVRLDDDDTTPTERKSSNMSQEGMGEGYKHLKGVKRLPMMAGHAVPGINKAIKKVKAEEVKGAESYKILTPSFWKVELGKCSSEEGSEVWVKIGGHA
jgi:hypothetical protein